MSLMLVKAVLKPGTDVFSVFNDLYCCYRTNISEENGKTIVYFTGNEQLGEKVRDYLAPISEQISTQIEK